MKPEWLSISAYARAYGVDRTTVHKWLRHGLLIHYRVGFLVRVKNIPPDEHEHADRRPADTC